MSRVDFDARVAANRTWIARQRERRLCETAGRYATCQDLARLARLHHLPIKRWNAGRRHWRRAFAFAYVEQFDVAVSADAINHALARMQREAMYE